MTIDIKTILSSQLPIDNSVKKSIKQLPIDAVDKLADELVATYKNPSFRQWYCGVIYEFGFAQVSEWRERSKEGREPAKLFSKYVKDTRLYKSPRI
jgi:hypothetical protein